MTFTVKISLQQPSGGGFVIVKHFTFVRPLSLDWQLAIAEDMHMMQPMVKQLLTTTVAIVLLIAAAGVLLYFQGGHHLPATAKASH